MTSELSSLQETVETARAAYARASEQHTRSRKHVKSLISIVEEHLREKRVELSQNEVQRERMTREYVRLQQMLHELVVTVEGGQTVDVVELNAVNEVAEAPQAPAPAEQATLKIVEDNETRDLGGGQPADPDELRAGLKRALKKKRASAAKTANPEQARPAE